MGNFEISVVMLTYNREEFVGRAVESVLSQTFCDFEFIIVDNGSVDKSGVIADEYAAKDERIKVIHRERGNIGSGRNAGLCAAKGEYITFIDDDDWCEPDYLEFLYNLASENNADVAICGAFDKIYDEKHVMNAEKALIELMWRKKYGMAFPTKLFARKLAEKICFSNTDKFDDISQMHRLLAYANKVAYHGLPKYTFYRHDGNNSAWTTSHELLDEKTLCEYLKAYRTRTEWLSEKFPKSADKWRYFEWSFMLSMVEKINRLQISHCEKQKQFMLCELRKNYNEFSKSELILDFEKEWLQIINNK